MAKATKTATPTSADARSADAAERRAPQGPRAAAARAQSRHSVTVDLAGRQVELPSKEQLTFLAGLGLLAALEVIEWPVALAIGIGHGLAHSQHGAALRDFGEALEEA
ncbi:hypothetical protein ACH4GZ_16245 [Streptomyces hygroscopicus]|uniref:hypothetical protein n=1 Tax=Streptomyces hygroscopicus TaxID=1912 RepID=UPI0037B42D95